MEIRPLLPAHADYILDLGQSDLTVRGYRQDLSYLCGSLRKTLRREPLISDLMLPTLQSWVTQQRRLGVGAACIQRRRCALRSFLAFLESREIAFPAKAGEVRTPKRHDPEPQYLTKEQTRTLVDHVADRAAFEDLSPFDRAVRVRNAAMLILDYEIGARRAEVVALDLKFLRWDTPARGGLVVLVKGKGKKFREVDVTYAQEPLRAWLALRSQYAHPRTSAVFVSVTRQGCRLRPTSYYEIVRRCAAQVGLKATPHLLRYSFATHLRDNGVDLAVIQLLLGHSRMTTTKLYAHTKREAMRAANARHPLNCGDGPMPTDSELLRQVLTRVERIDAQMQAHHGHGPSQLPTEVGVNGP